MALILAIARAQWLTAISWRRTGVGSGMLLGILAAAAWYGFWSILAFGAYSFCADSDSRGIFDAVLPRALLVVMLYWQIAPVVASNLGASLDTRALLAWPVPKSQLFLIEVVLRITAAPEMPILLAGAAFGLMRNPWLSRWDFRLAIAAASLGFIVFNLLLAAGIRMVLERLLGRKRVREVLSVGLILFSVSGSLMAMVALRQDRLFTGWHDPALLIFWPWAATAKLWNWGWSATPVAALAAWTLAAGWLGRWQFERSLMAEPETESGASGPRTPRLLELVASAAGRLLPDPAGAVIEKELLSMLRSSRFWMTYFMSFTFSVMFFSQRLIKPSGTFMASGNWLEIITLYSVALVGHVSYWNQFGFERAAAQAWFCWPVPLRRVIVGKNMAIFLLICGQLILLLVIAWMLPLGVTPRAAAEALLISLIVAFYLISAGNLSSIYFPQALLPARLTSGNGGAKIWFTTLLIVPVCAFPAGLAYAGRWAFDSELAFYALLGLDLLLGVVFYWVATDSAVEASVTRRERFLEEMARGDGPLSIR